MRPGVLNRLNTFHPKSGISWPSYWKSRSEVLFFGLYSEISDGKMPNKVIGATDYLIVSGSAGSETYQAPNTAPYQAADTDYIWFTPGVVQRAVTTAELIAYDFARTIVYYGDASPNAIVAVMILNEAVTSAKMRTDFHLSIWWDGTLSVYGNLKDNRGIGKSTWDFYDTASSALFVRMAAVSDAPTDARKITIDTAIRALKAAGLFETKFDALWVLRGHGAAATKLNWIKDAHNLTKGGAGTLTFAADTGYTSDGSSTYLDTNYTPYTDAVRLSQDNAVWGNKISGSIYTSGVRAEGGVSATGGTTGIAFGRNGASLYNNINDDTAGKGIAFAEGYNALSRISSSSFEQFTNDTKTTATSTNSVGLTRVKLFLLASNQQGSPNYYTTYTQELAYVGARLTQAEFNTLRTIFNAYIAAL